MAALRAYFRRRVLSDEVDDLVQDVLVNMQARSSPSAIDNPEAYLFTVARNVLARHRQRKGLGHSQAESDALNFVRDAGPLQDRMILDREELELALRTIETMPARTRDVFLMHRFDEMTYGAIARRLGISVSAVEKHIMAALHTLVTVTGRRR